MLTDTLKTSRKKYILNIDIETNNVKTIKTCIEWVV